MRVFFVSSHLPRDIRKNAHGVFKRMRIFLDAIKESADVDLLFYVGPNADVSGTHATQMAKALAREWDLKAAHPHVRLVHRFFLETGSSRV